MIVIILPLSWKQWSLKNGLFANTFLIMNQFCYMILPLSWKQWSLKNGLFANTFLIMNQFCYMILPLSWKQWSLKNGLFTNTFLIMNRFCYIILSHKSSSLLQSNHEYSLSTEAYEHLWWRFFAKTVNGLKSLVLQKQKDINQKMSKT